MRPSMLDFNSTFQIAPAKTNHKKLENNAKCFKKTTSVSGWCV